MQKKERYPKTVCILGFVLPLLVALNCVIAAGQKPAAATQVQERTLFVAPFEDKTELVKYRSVPDGLTDLLGVFLAEHEHIKVVDRQHLKLLSKEEEIILAGKTGAAHALQAAKFLKADVVLTGRVSLEKGRLTARMDGLEVSTARLAVRTEAVLTADSLMNAALSLAKNVAERLATPLPEIDLAKIDKSPAAGLHFAKGISVYYLGDLDTAIMHFMEATNVDPYHAPAHYWAGKCYRMQKEHGHAAIEFTEYLALAPDGPHAAEVKAALPGLKKAAAEVVAAVKAEALKQHRKEQNEQKAEREKRKKEKTERARKGSERRLKGIQWKK